MCSKKWGLIASASLLGATASFAQTAAVPALQVTGVVDTGYATTNHVLNSKNQAAGKSGGTDSILGVSNIGFSGGKDLGEGNQAFYNFQIGFNPSQGKLSGGSENIFSRNAYIGLKGQPGSLSIGKQWNFNDDWLVGSVFKGGYNAGAIFKFSEFDAVSDIYNNTIKYVSPDMNGLQVGGMYGSSYQTAKGDGGTMSNVGVKYATGPWHLAGTTFSEKSGDLGGTYRLNTYGVSFAASPTVKLRLGQSNSKIGAGTYVSVGDYSGLGTAGTDAKVTNFGVDFAVQPKLTLSLDALHRTNQTNVDDSTNVSRFLAVYAWRPDISFVANYATLHNSSKSTQTLVGSTNPGLSQNSLALGVRMTF